MEPLLARGDGPSESHRATERRAREHEEALAQQIKALETAHAASEGALRAARSERMGLTYEIELLRARLAEANAAAQAITRGDQALRQAIARLGRDIIGRDQDEESGGLIVNFNRREPASALTEEAPAQGHATEGPTSLSRPRIL